MKKRLFQGLITCVVMSSLIVTPVLANPQDDVKSIESQKKQMEAQAAGVNGQLVNLLVEYDALKADISAQEGKIAEAESNLKIAEEKEKEQYEDMKLRIKYMYEQGDTSFVETLVSSKSYADLVSKAEYVQNVHKYDRNMLAEYVKTKEEVTELKGSLEEGQAEMQSMADEMQLQKGNLESTLTEMRSQISDFDTQLAEAEAEAQRQLQQMIEQSQDDGDKPSTGTTAKPGNGGNNNSQSNNGNQSNSSKPGNNNNNSNNKPNNNNGGNTASKPGNSGNTTSKPGNSGNAASKPGNSGSTAPKPGNTALGQQIANKGCEYIGNPYVYSGNSLTNGIDCSGFVQQIHAKFGIYTPRTSDTIRSGGKAVAYADKLPGDVICYSGHVAIYIGGNTVVHASNSAPYPKGGIKTTSPANYRTVLAVRRYW